MADLYFRDDDLVLHKLALAESGDQRILIVRPEGYDPTGGKMLVGTAQDRFVDDFAVFDTSESGNWEVLETGSGMTVTGPLGGGAAGSTKYININSGTTAGARHVLLSRGSWKAPFELKMQISASQRIANSSLRIGFVEVDKTTGQLVTDTAISTATPVLGARNAAFLEWSGTVATTGAILARASGCVIDNTTAAFGGVFTSAATGTSPNFILTTGFSLSLNRDKVACRSYTINATTNAGTQFGLDRTLPNPNSYYKIAIIVENGGTAPASATDWRIHQINLLDNIRFDVGFRDAGTTDLSRSMTVTGNLNVLNSSLGVQPSVPATPYILNSAATTNAALILTGTSGLQGVFATNTGATPAYVKLYNKATAPVPGTDVPAVVIPIDAAANGVPGVAQVITPFSGYRFALGLGIAITGGAADTDTTAVAAGQVKVILSRTV